MFNISKSFVSKKALLLIVAVFVFLLYGNSEPDILVQSQLDLEPSASTIANTPDTFGCATMEVYSKMIREDKEFEIRQSELESFTKEYVKKSVPGDEGIIRIPVVVHIIYNTPVQNISNAVVQSQIDVLNTDFRRRNADTINTPLPFRSLGSDSQIEFVLAKRDPLGNPSIGITRTQTSVTTFGGDNVKFTSLGGHDIWDRDKYLNIWVCNLYFTGGYSQFPGGNPNTDGNVIHYTVFGNIGAFGNSNGRTTTHEIGHWLNLRHIWGDALCGNDFVDDTPIQETQNFSCPSFPHVTCGNGPNGDMYMNYMDYTSDNCKNIYTIGQSNRMNASLNSLRSSLLNSNGGIPVSGVPIAHFRTDNFSINIGQNVSFYDESGGIPTSWQWTFSGGIPLTSNEQNPIVSYLNPGFYSVKLRITNSYGTDSVNYINYVRVNGVNMSAFSIVYPPSNTIINTSSLDTARNVFTWTKSSSHPSIRYKWKIRRNGYPGEFNYYSENNGSDSLISLSNSLLDSIAMSLGVNNDTAYCLWRVNSYNGTDSLISQNQFVLYLVRNAIGIQVISSLIPNEFRLNQNYPNPFNPTTKIRFALAKNTFVKLVVYDLLGREVAALVNEQLNAGIYQTDWNAGRFASGVYYYRLVTEEYTEIRKMVLIK